MKAPSPREEVADPCEPLRANLARIQQEMEDVRLVLAEPDIPEEVRESHEAMLRDLQRAETRALEDLRTCEAEQRNDAPA